MKNTLNIIRAMSSYRDKRPLTGKNALVKDLTDFLFQESDIKYQFAMLCTEDYMILNCFSPEQNFNLTGSMISKQALAAIQDQVTFHYLSQSFILCIISEEEPSRIDHMCSKLETLLMIFDSNISNITYLLDCLDAIENPICIFDKAVCFLYGNKKYCETMNISDREKAVGMHVNDLFKASGTNLRYPNEAPRELKIFDVLSTGQKKLDCALKINFQDAEKKPALISTNIYPVKDSHGEVSGAIELLHSSNLDLKKINKSMGSKADYTFDSIVGSSSIMKETIEQAEEYAKSEYPVLVIGESGVGKELFSQAIHNHSNRSNSTFVALNCANFPESLIESELFGYASGSFTGASKDGQIGKFELADGGTLFLDEIGELPYRFQPKLLRVLETGKFTKVGGIKEIEVDVRIIAATNRDLESMVKEGLFREDLYYRLQVLTVEIPPLRKRCEDTVKLAELFLEENSFLTSSDYKKTLNDDAKKYLMKYDWPGNVRELRNVIQRITLLSRDKAITSADLETAIHSRNHSFKSKSKSNETPEVRLQKCKVDIDKSYEKLITEALDITKGNKRKAAKLLEVSPATFYRMMEKYCHK